MKINKEMLTLNSEKSRVSYTLKRLWKKELVKTLFLMSLFAVSVLLFKVVLVTALKTDYPLHTPVSPSMEPTLNIGDLLIVQGVSSSGEINADPEHGDIIIFRDPNNPEEGPYVHRVIEKTWNPEDNKYYFETKGDNVVTNPLSDQKSGMFPPIPEDYVLGKVIWRVPFLGYTEIFLGTPVGMTIIIIIFLALLFLEAK